jgi:hypothetical protein
MVICLSRPSDYEPSDGARFLITFTKLRGMCGQDVDPFEVGLVDGAWSFVETRQVLNEQVKVATSMGSSEVLEALYPLLLERGTPMHIRSDNSPEFVSAPFQEWLRRVGIEPIRIYPGSPWENGYNERFNGTLRREVRNAEWFASTRHAQIVINQWLKQYNHIRPHHALAMRPPVPETLLERFSTALNRAGIPTGSDF